MADDSGISDQEARELWRRAVELQAADERKRATRRAAVPAAAQGDLTLAHVAEAAEGAGIEPDYVRLALAERRLADGDEIRRDRWTARWLRVVVGHADAIDHSRVIAASPDRVLRAFQAVVSKPAFELLPEDGIGEDPLVDGVLVYRSHGSTSFHFHLSWGDVRVVIVTIRAEGDGSRIRLRAPLFRRGVNLAVAGGLTGGGGAVGAAGGSAAGGALAGWIGTASLAVVMAPAVVGALACAAAGVAGFRKLYGSAAQTAETALRRLTRAVAVEAEGPHPAGGPPLGPRESMRE